jgi:hypothetical protein
MTSTSHHAINVASVLANVLNTIRRKKMAKMASLHEETTHPTAVSIDEDHWINAYIPITHSPVDKVDSWIPERHVWTLVETDGKLYILNGFRVVNKIGYHITEERWKFGQEIEVRIND